MESPSSRSCLICNENVVEVKPAFGEEADRIVAEFRESFRCFCELIWDTNPGESRLNDIIKGVIGQIQTNQEPETCLVGVPCCSVCSRALEKIAKIKNGIEKLKVNLMSNVASLRDALVESTGQGCNEDWSLVRRQICSLIQPSQYPAAKIPPRNLNFLHSSTPAKHGKFMPNILRRKSSKDKCSFSQPLKIGDKSEDTPPQASASPPLCAINDTFTEDDFNCDFDVISPPSSVLDVSSGRDGSSLDHDSVVENLRYKYRDIIRPCSVLLKRIEPEPLAEPKKVSGADKDIDRDDDSALSNKPQLFTNDKKFKCQYCDESYKRKPNLMRHHKRLHRGKPPPPRECNSALMPKPSAIVSMPLQEMERVSSYKSTHFWQLNDHLLLYKYTVIQVSCGGTQLSCLEPGCSHVANVPDLDYQTLFNKMGLHVDVNHSKLPSRGEHEQLPGLKCPLPGCLKEFQAQTDFRGHILKGHSIELVICEICWKPVKQRAHLALRHKWSHKNEQERLQTIPTRNILGKMNKTIRTQFQAIMIDQPKPTKVAPPPRKRSKAPEVESSKPIDNCNGIRPKRSYTKKISAGTDLKRKYGCQFCNASYKKKQTLMNHHVRYHPEVPLPPKEKQRRKDRNKAKYDIVSHFPGKNLFFLCYTFFQLDANNCVECLEPDCTAKIPGGMEYTAIEEFKSHVKTSHMDEKSRKCLLCPSQLEEFTSGRLLRDHLFSGSHGDCPFRCDSCGKSFSKQEGLKEHGWSHLSSEEKIGRTPPTIVKYSKPGGFICQHCGRVFNNEIYLKSHVACHVPNELRAKWLCSECPSKFMSAAALRLHSQRIHHPDEGLFRSCPYCNKKIFYRDGTRYRRHVQGHLTKEKQFRCDKCGLYFWSKSLMKQHDKTVHLNERNFKCDHCPESYKYKKNLTRHLRATHADLVTLAPVNKKYVHLEYRPEFYGPKIAFPCEICEKVFPLRSRMTKHVKLCHGDKK